MEDEKTSGLIGALNEFRESDKRLFTCTAPKKLITRLRAQSRKDNYSSKQVSFWVETALIKMASNEDWVIDSLQGDKIDGDSKTKFMPVLTKKGEDALTQACLALRKDWLLQTGIKSLAVRCAIRFRLNHPELFSEYRMPPRPEKRKSPEGEGASKRRRRRVTRKTG